MATCLEVAGAAFLPNVYAARLDLETFSLVETTSDKREDVEGDGVEKNVSVAGRANANAGVGRELHVRGKKEQRTREGNGEKTEAARDII